MKKNLLLFILLYFLVGISLAQTPYTWSFKATRISDKIFDIHCVADMQAPWHTYSQFTPDGGPLPTKFTFLKNPLFRLVGVVKENGKLIVKYEEVFGIDVRYFERNVDFVQRVKLRGSAKTNFSGTIEFMVCNDQQCLPPSSLKFTVALD